MSVSAGNHKEKPRRAPLGLLAAAGLIAGAAATIRMANRRLDALETLDPQTAAPDGRFVTVDGVTLHYLDSGTVPSGEPPVLLIHGFLSSTSSWRHTVPALAAHTRVLALDLPPFGFSARVTEPVYSMRWWADLVAGFLTALEIPCAVIIGNSMGGAVAVQTAISHPARVAGLVVVDGAVEGTDRRPPPWLARGLLGGPVGRAFLYFTLENPRFERRMADLAWADPSRFTETERAAYRAPARVRDTARALLALTASARDDDLATGVSGITAPTLIVWGAQDRMIPAAVGERLQAGIPGSRLEVLPDCGHAPQEECPVEFQALLSAFLAGIAARAPVPAA